MGIFQSQFNAMLGSLVGKQLLGSVNKMADNSDWIATNTGKN